jgi:hypothetical protein
MVMCGYGQKLPPLLLPFMRVAYCEDVETLRKEGIQHALQEGPIETAAEGQAREQLKTYLQDRLGR